MTKRKKKVLFVLISLCLLVGSKLYLDARHNAPAWEVYDRLNPELQTALAKLNVGEELSVGKIGGVKWDRVCFLGEYQIPLREIGKVYKEKKVSSFSSADGFSTDALNGLAFVSFEQKLVVAVTIRDSLDETVDGPVDQTDKCAPAERSVLQLLHRPSGRTYVNLQHRK